MINVIITVEPIRAANDFAYLTLRHAVPRGGLVITCAGVWGLIELTARFMGSYLLCFWHRLQR